MLVNAVNGLCIKKGQNLIKPVTGMKGAMFKTANLRCAIAFYLECR
jgi:hypothetical protein